jgi:hypothetical protein
MKALFPLAVTALLAASVGAEVYLTVYTPDQETVLLPDPNTGCYSVMAGTRLPLVISSDMGGVPWDGSLGIATEFWGVGTLSGRGRDDDPNLHALSYPGSALEAAGWRPDVLFRCVDVSRTSMFTFLAAWHSQPGDWFVIDYRAQEPGYCEVDLFEFAVSFETPVRTLCFEHAPSRDFNEDDIVDFVDFALLAGQYGSVVEPGTLLDFDQNGLVDAQDVAQFSNYWLTITDANEPLLEEPPPPCFPDGE